MQDTLISFRNIKHSETFNLDKFYFEKQEEAIHIPTLPSQKKKLFGKVQRAHINRGRLGKRKFEERHGEILSGKSDFSTVMVLKLPSALSKEPSRHCLKLCQLFVLRGYLQDTEARSESTE